MASVDHTIIGFKNGKLLENLYFVKFGEKQVVDENGDTYNEFFVEAEKNFIPFDYNRDGLITFEGGYTEKYMDIYPELGFWEKGKKPRDRRAKRYMKKCLKQRKQYEKALTTYSVEMPTNYRTRYGYLKDNEKEVIVVITENYNVTFYFTENDSYILLGGYGHHANPYTHFYHRGYSKRFERKMCRECYNWLCEDVLEEALREIRGLEASRYEYNNDYDRLLKKLNHIHWLDRHGKQAELIKIDPDASDEAEKIFKG
jgi:hypothetical protein